MAVTQLYNRTTNLNGLIENQNLSEPENKEEK